MSLSLTLCVSLVLATDGLWERATNDQVVDIVAEYMEGPKEKSKWAHQDESAATHVIRNVFGGKDSEAVASLLKIPPPLSRFFRDDITITVVFLKPFPSKTSLNYTDPPIAGAQEINLPSKL
ncbi:hypothetical protein HMI54_011112 [Coelomomyces lativittatus]|nr:hypothetical protein HMI54_011112 [Coelomomyces lativittatus]